MAASFVPVLFYAEGAAAFRSWIDRASPQLTSSAQRTSRGKAAGSCSVATKDDKGGVVKGSAPAREGDSWVEIPITSTLLGYETREERAKFTVYKILVIGGKGDSWVIFRRYTDFCRLSNKLKELFPAFRLGLPPKRWFKDNYNGEFLEDRQVGLQAFLQNLMNHKDIISSEAVRRFLCLVHPPSPFDSLEESRAFCETLEETNHRLQRELLEKQGELGVLKKNLEEREKRIGLLLKKVKAQALQPGNFEDPPGLLATLLTSVNGEENPQKHTELLNDRTDDGKAWRNKSSEPRWRPDVLLKGHGVQ